MLPIDFENVSATRIGIAVAVTFGFLVLLGVVLRRLKNSKVLLTGDRGRARQPRLGIVDVYDLDRQRQLILLRRDNVEHLLLVGGPNDVVVETNIVRTPGARLPSPPDAADVAAERSGESPARPVIETNPSPPPETLASGPANDAGPPAVTGRGPVAGRIGVSPQRNAPAALPSPDPRGGERSRATTPPPPGLVAVRAAASRGAGPSPAARNPAPEPGRDGSAGDRAVLSGMARELEDVLKRPSENRPPDNRPRRGPEPTRMPAVAPPARLESAPVARPAGLRGRTEPTTSPRGEPEPPEPAPASSANPQQTPAQPAPVDEGSASSASPAKDAAPAAENEPKTSVGETAPAANPEVAASAPPPSDAQPTPPAESTSAPAQPERAQQPPEPTPSRSDPFSIEDIEAEFARLLGRPLDRRDRS